MLTAQRDSIRLLHGILVASLALPAALFVYASWLGYQNNQAVADRQIDRTRDVVTEHALKVFESVERSIAEINEVVRDMPDERIAANEENLHRRFQRLADSSEQIKSVWIFDKNGRALVNSLVYPAPTIDFSDRDYFKAHVERDIGIYIGEVLRPRPPYGGAPFFGISRRRSSPDGSFNGVIQTSILPEYFSGFYAKISREAGSYASLIRDDGLILARFPPSDIVALFPNGELLKAIRANSEGALLLTSKLDNIERKVAYRKVAGFPAFVVAGLETQAIRAQWFSQMASHLIFGLPATAALIAIVLLALKRTRRFYEEATRRQAAENALKQSQRLEALGQLTGGVAHDFNNLLMVVEGSAQRLKRRHHDPADLRSLDMIESAVRKGSSLTRQLLSFARRQSLSPKVVDLVDCIGKFREILRQSIPGDIEIDLKIPPRQIPVRIDPDEFEIALLNLTLNARDAMPDGGRITIAVKTTELDENSPASGMAGKVAVIAFSDTGSGIADDIRDRIFEPFFTTKKVDRGTGLGLSQVYGFVQQSKGAITVASQPGAGTTFELLLPCCEEGLPAEGEAADVAAPPLKSATVLLVEDHPDVSAVGSDYVEQCGFKVVCAASAEVAVDILNKRSDIDLVFSDIVMPGMSGLELGRLIREHHPETPVVLASGYSDRAAAAVAEGFVLLQKPYSLEALRKSLAEAMQPDATDRNFDAPASRQSA
ncbi:MAG: two-component system, NtrC family, sensor kinase [Bradyrhizobium sp.]|jgi:two-component system NtrC family sensor kinase|nr:two-component system, NtrC family, sensor kinase [Bradyrhizobium sp.]